MESIVSIVVALVTGLLSLLGVIITNSMSNKSIENQLLTSQAVTDNKIENLTAEVKRHNDFATRIPKLETRIEYLEKEIKDVKHE